MALRPPPPKGRWAYVTTDLRVLLTCAACGSVISGAYRAQHNAWHEYLTELARAIDQPALFDEDNQPPPF